MEWKNTDPRHEIYKLSTIIILRSRWYNPRICLATVETKHEYFVTTGFENQYKHLGVDDEWPEDWMWIRLDKEVLLKIENALER